MKQFFEVLFGVFMVIIVVFISAQGVVTNTQISTAREYHETCIERIENTGLSEEFIDDLVDYTNNNTNYKLTVEKVDGPESTYSYHVSLKYPVRTVIYEMFGKNNTGKYAIIDGYASVGKSSPSTTSSVVEKHGNVLYTYTLGTGITGTYYEDGFLIIEGNGDITYGANTLDDVKSLTTNLVFTGKINKIPDNYFSDFVAIEGINFGKVQEVGSEAFAGCDSLKTVSISSSVKAIGDNAFNNCTNLEYIYVNNSIDNVTLGKDITEGCDSFLNIVYLKN